MDEGTFDAENGHIQIKKLKEKVKSLVLEVDLCREIRSDDFPKTSKSQLECNANVISHEFETVDEDADEFSDIKELDFTNEANWLVDWNGNCNAYVESSSDIFNFLYSEVEEFHADISDLYRELQVLRNSSSQSLIDLNKSNNRSGSIDSRTFTRPKKYTNRPPLTSIISNTGDDGRQRKLQRRPTNAASPTSSLSGKIEDLNKIKNRSMSGAYDDSNWNEGSEEGLADIENASRKNQRKSLPASIIDRLQELKRSNNSYVISRTSESSRHLNAVNGNLEESDKIRVSEDARRVKPTFDLNVKSTLSNSYKSDLFKNIPEYFSDDNESFFNLDEVSGFCDRLTLSIDPSTYSSIVREMRQNEICFNHSATYLEETSLSRMTFGGKEIPLNSDGNAKKFSSSKEELLELENDTNETFKVLYESTPKENRTFEIKDTEGNSEPNVAAKYDAEKRANLFDDIMQSDVVKSSTPNRNSEYCDNRNVSGSGAEGCSAFKNASDNVNQTYTQNELNKMHSEKYTTKIFDATFKKISPSDGHNGKRDSDHSEDDGMSTTSDNSCRSLESNSELKNIEELKNIALQQSKRLSDGKFSTPKFERSRGVRARNIGEWRNISPIEKDDGDGESKDFSNASSREPNLRETSVPSVPETSRRNRPFSVRQAPKVPQRELKLKPALLRPPQNFKKLVGTGRSSAEPISDNTNTLCKTNKTSVGKHVIKQAVAPLSAVTSTTNSSKPNTRIPSGIPRPPSRLKQPQIRASEVYKK